MTPVCTTVFKSNKTQAVQLPKTVALPDTIKSVKIVAVGNTRIITPAGESWDQWFGARGVSDDFMLDRDQPADQEREAFKQHETRCASQPSQKVS
ncbi:type II toxin-antitoxin system VapB family antitoxin [Pseudomonadota bacterium]